MTTRIALVGERSDHVVAHRHIADRLRLTATAEPVECHWLRTDHLAGGRTGELSDDDLAGFDGIWLTPGSPYASEDGALAAVRITRERGIPFLGTCGGFQHALLEFARNVAGLPQAGHTENDPTAAEPMIDALACALTGHRDHVTARLGSRAAAAVGTRRRLENFNCTYGLVARFEPALQAAGLDIVGRDDEGAARIVELAGHSFFVATLFQPELWGEPDQVHPLIEAFAAAASHRAVERTAAERAVNG